MAITIDDIDGLRNIASEIRACAEDSHYGHFVGGDPRDFSPDPECCSEDEYAAWKSACERWENGDHVECKPAMVTELEDGDKVVSRMEVGGHLIHAHVERFGFGVNTIRDPELLKLANDLDALTDRIRSNAQIHQFEGTEP